MTLPLLPPAFARARACRTHERPHALSLTIRRLTAARVLPYGKYTYVPPWGTVKRSAPSESVSDVGTVGAEIGTHVFTQGTLGPHGGTVESFSRRPPAHELAATRAILRANRMLGQDVGSRGAAAGG